MRRGVFVTCGRCALCLTLRALVCHVSRRSKRRRAPSPSIETSSSEESEAEEAEEDETTPEPSHDLSLTGDTL